MEGLSVICAGLGHVEEDDRGDRIDYKKGKYCLDNLKDLLRFLRRDDPQTREVFKQICKWNTVSKDLIPIIEYCQDDHDLVLNAVKVLVFVTMPIEHSSNDISQQIEYLWELKLAITSSDTIAVILTLLESPLENLQQEAFTEDDWKLVQLVLTLFRNVLAVQDFSLMQKAGGSATHFTSSRDRFLELLFNEHVMDLILVLTQHIGGSCGYLRHDNLLLLETFHYFFMGQDAELIARAQQGDSKEEAQTTDSIHTLKTLMEEEERKIKLIRLTTSSRHSQFSGTFTRVSMDGSKALFKGNPGSTLHDPFLRPQKVYNGPSKRIVWDHERLPSVKNNILVLLHEFMNQFLLSGYNVLMQSIREDIEKEHPSIQNSDVVVFFQVAHFVISFQYHKILIYEPTKRKDSVEAFADKYADNTLFKGDICGSIAASMNESMFHLVISKWRDAFDGLKELGSYKFLSAAGSLMKTMIRMLDLVLKQSPNDSKEPHTARVLLYKLFYDQTDEGVTQFLFNLIKTFNFHKQPKSDLADLVEMIHVIIRLMENLLAQGTLRVSKKSRKLERKKTHTRKKDNADAPNGDHATVDCEKDGAGCEKSELSNSEKESSFNACSAQEEHAHVDEPQTSMPEMCNLADNASKVDKDSALTHDDSDRGIDDSSDDELPAVTDEVNFNLSTLFSALANNFIIHNLCWLLKFYKNNSVRTNHYIVSLLERICEDLEFSPMLYQLSVLTTFYDILAEQKSSPCREYEHIVSFLTNFVRRMLRKMKNQPLLFVELLFWKTRRECQEINADSLLHELGGLKKQTKAWANASNNGCSGSSKRKTGLRRSIGDALGDDEADVPISHTPYSQRDEGQFQEPMPVKNDDNFEIIINSNNDEKEILDKEENSVEDEIQKVSKKRKKFVLDAEMEKNITDLYKKYEGNKQCSRLIAEALGPKEKVLPRQVSNVLKRLGLKITPREKKTSDKKHGNGESLTDVGGPVRSASHTRKRVHAFSKEKEAMIQDLFKLFKDDDRCNSLIANALDAEGAISEIQVSRKLKKLGLSTHKKVSKTNTNLMVENLNDHLLKNSPNSDDETLISLKKRKSRSVKQKKVEKLAKKLVANPEVEDISGNRAMQFQGRADSSLGGKEKGEEIGEAIGPNQDEHGEVSGFSGVEQSNAKLVVQPDDEVREGGVERLDGEPVEIIDHVSLQQTDGYLADSSLGCKEKGEEIGEAIGQNHDEHGEVSGFSGAERSNAKLVVQPDDEAREGGVERLDGEPVEIIDHVSLQQTDGDFADELEDSGDDAAIVASSKATVRRKLRMVLDFDEDE